MKKIFETILLISLLYSSVFSVRISVEISDNLLVNKRSIQEWAQEDYQRLKDLWKIDLSFPMHITVEKPSDKWGGESFLSVNSYNIVLSSSSERIRRTLTHEMMHLFNFEWDLKNNVKTPLWIVEGIACWWESTINEQKRSISPLIALNRDMLDVVNVKEYPHGEKLLAFYSAVEDLFLKIDKTIDLRKNLPVLFKVAKSTGWERALSSFLKNDFSRFYERWKFEVLLISLLKLLYYNVPWLIVITLLVLIVFIRSRLHRNFNDDLSELEKIYGKNYWLNKDNEKF
ncbi:MAG: hypothetical protein PWQ20_889 [Thermotogaceae bacterium]|nr:hypothetical protein [Thermotogaceae bacterium]MDN5337819.1 hypothetical protein [Thermotogaceae bacterium]